MHAITSLTVQPTGLKLAVGAKGMIVATVVQPTGTREAELSYRISPTGIATVSNGVVAATAPGTASVTITARALGDSAHAATTLTQLVPVVVTP